MKASCVVSIAKTRQVQGQGQGQGRALRVRRPLPVGDPNSRTAVHPAETPAARDPTAGLGSAGGVRWPDGGRTVAMMSAKPLDGRGAVPQSLTERPVRACHFLALSFSVHPPFLAPILWPREQPTAGLRAGETRTDFAHGPLHADKALVRPGSASHRPAQLHTPAGSGARQAVRLPASQTSL